MRSESPVFDEVVEVDAAPPLVRAIQDQAGLKLETRRGVVEVVVIDDARRPSGNE